MHIHEKQERLGVFIVISEYRKRAPQFCDAPLLHDHLLFSFNLIRLDQLPGSPFKNDILYSLPGSSFFIGKINVTADGNIYDVAIVLCNHQTQRRICCIADKDDILTFTPGYHVVLVDDRRDANQRRSLALTSVTVPS